MGTGGDDAECACTRSDRPADENRENKETNIMK